MAGCTGRVSPFELTAQTELLLLPCSGVNEKVKTGNGGVIMELSPMGRNLRSGEEVHPSLGMQFFKLLIFISSVLMYYLSHF